MQTPTTPLFNDSTCKRVAKRVFHEESSLKAIDPVLAVFIDRFKARHRLFTARVSTRRQRRAAMMHLREARDTCREELFLQLLQGWENVPSVGATFERKKSQAQVRKQRMALCPQGRPHPHFALARLVEIGTEMLEYLTADNPLARAWPSAHLDRLHAALSALEATDQPFEEARSAHKAAFLALQQERLLWTRDFVLLRDNALRLVEPGPVHDWLTSLFSDWTKEKPSTTRKKATQAEAPPEKDPEELEDPEMEDELDDPDFDNGEELEEGETSS